MIRFLSGKSSKKLYFSIATIIIFTLFLSILAVNLSAAPVTSGNFTIDYAPQNDWGSGATVSVKITNTGAAVKDWTINWTFPGNQKISNMWNATYTQSGAAVTVKNVAWNGAISTNGSQTFGFNLTYSGSNSSPTSFTASSSSSPVVSPVTSIPTIVPTIVPTTSSATTTQAPVTTIPTSVTSSPQNTATKIKGSEVLVIGESFIAMSHEITRNLEQNAKNAGIIASNESFRDNSVSGTRLSGGISPTIPQQYQNAKQQSPVKYVIMDGGGNDCLQSGGTASADNPELKNAVSAAQTLLNQMGTDGVVKVVYFFYPEPQGSSFSGLKSKLDVLRPMIQNVVNTSSKPNCYWLDLRPVFEGKYSQYITSDGIHPTSAGCKATADAIWKVIQDNNFFGTN